MTQNESKAATAPDLRTYGQEKVASFQVIILGGSGGPREDNVTGLLVRASQAEWRKGSLIAVDAGALLASIIRILQKEMPRSSETVPEPGYRQVLQNGPFAGIKFPHISAKANALFIFRELLHSILITHPHLDHISAIAINTPALEYGREAKPIYGLPSTIDAIKNHIFNNWIWPNLSDEGHGVGFVTFCRLIEGGNPRLGSGEARGYINVCDGLATKCWGVSHGKCHRRAHNASHQHGESFGFGGNDYNYSRRMSRMSDDYFAAIEHHRPTPAAYAPGHPPAIAPTPGIHGSSQPPSAIESTHMFETVSSSAFFIRNDEDGKELLIFGDVEPDSVSMSPRNHIIWDDAATKFVHGSLKAIFIECSYDDSVRNEDLYGHLCPRHLIAEITFLAHAVMAIRNHQANTVATKDDTTTAIAVPEVPSHVQAVDTKRKRKRPNGDPAATPETTQAELAPSSASVTSAYVGSRSASGTRRKVSHPHTVPIQVLNQESPANRPGTPKSSRKVEFEAPGNPSVTVPSGGLAGIHNGTAGAKVASQDPLPQPLKGLTVHIIHVKDTLMDGPSPGTVILKQVKSLGGEVGLGCEFNVVSWGESIWV